MVKSALTKKIKEEDPKKMNRRPGGQAHLAQTGGSQLVKRVTDVDTNVQ